MDTNELYPGHHFINARWIKGEGTDFHSINPATNKLFWHGSEATEAEVHQAVAAAKEAFPAWSMKNADDRAALCKQFAQVVDDHKNQLAELIAQENGKPLWEALSEAGSVIAKVNISITAYQERTGARQFSSAAGESWLRYKPHGVVAVLGAFNFPAHLSNGHIVPALLAGNTLVLKPSELTPAVSQFIMLCWHKAGLPAGVINCIQGGVRTGQYLLNEDLQGVYFTGSYSTGKKIHQHFAGRPDIILALEMGGNNPLVVDKVDNIQAAVYNTLMSSMVSSGQRCTCARRLMVPNNDFGQLFLQQFKTACERLSIGAWDSQPEPFMGPVIRSEHAKNHMAAQSALIDQGGEPLLTMKNLPAGSAFLSAGIIDMTGVEHIEDEEIFAPLVQVFRYDDFDQAIALANQSSYGLSAGLLSDSDKHYQQFFAQTRAGLINWNRPTTGAAGNLPFGGVGRSGNHRPSAYFAADYCAYPIASVETTTLTVPGTIMPGIQLD